MARRQELFAAGSAHTRGRLRGSLALIFFLFFFALLFVPPLRSESQDSTAPTDSADNAASSQERLSRAQQAFDQKRYDEAARIAQGPANQSADLDFLAGLALAKLQRWQDSRTAFEAGHLCETPAT
jgi:hypothetical protein